MILEAPADFTRELSIIAARGRDGATAVYPLAEARNAFLAKSSHNVAGKIILQP